MTTFEKLYRNAKDTPEYLAAGVQLDVAHMIENAMQHQNISNAYLAKILGCSRAYVTKLLRGDQNFSILSLAKVADALHCDLKIAMSTKDQPLPSPRPASKHLKQVRLSGGVAAPRNRPVSTNRNTGTKARRKA